MRFFKPEIKHRSPIIRHHHVYTLEESGMTASSVFCPKSDPDPQLDWIRQPRKHAMICVACDAAFRSTPPQNRFLNQICRAPDGTGTATSLAGILSSSPAQCCRCARPSHPVVVVFASSSEVRAQLRCLRLICIAYRNVLSRTNAPRYPSLVLALTSRSSTATARTV